ncbi:MAG: thiamine-binding protein [Candidatus Hydrogenedentes bacterium]|nr:thiamine-binding protein [Candidatus Hydrogenedentota bacterium]
MKIDVEVSLYPLRTANLSEPIDCFLEQLREAELEVESGPMSSHIRGECVALFRSLGEAFEQSVERGGGVLIVKASNACR